MRHFFALLCLLLCLPGLAQEATEPADAYVIATHYPAFGGTEPAPMNVIKASYNNYNNATNDYYGVTQAQVDAIVERIQAEANGVEVLIWNAWEQAQENVSALQIVNNVPLGSALYTIFLPPRWNRSKDLPVVLSGNGAGTSNNRRFYGGEADMGIVVALSARLGSGIIGALSNCGGTESQGVNSLTYESVGEFFAFIDANGGDRHNAITAGWSRGGGTAAMWAANPLDLDYTVHTAFIGIPPASYGGLATVSPSTYPNMSSIATLISGDPDAYRFDHDGPMKPGMVPSPFLEVILGTADPAGADAIGLMGTMERLRGKAIVIDAGSHDAFFSLRFALDYDRALTEAGIAHTTAITYNSGHEDTDYVRNLLVQAIVSAMYKRPFTPPNGRYLAIDVSPRDDDEMSLKAFYEQQGITADPNQLMVHLEVPFRVGQGDPYDLVFCGPPGAEVGVELLSQADGEAVFSLPAQAVPATECVAGRFNADYPPGAYRWVLKVNGEAVPDVNSAGVARVDGSNTKCSWASAMFVEDDQPTPENARAGLGSMSYGVLQYAPVPECLAGTG
jgi:pimeloyl-ACP methyl ester carboxylesterase